MATELKKIGNSQYEVVYTVTGEELKKAKEKALKVCASKVNLKGFRKGKAPIQMVKDHISPLDLANQTINEAIQPALNAVLNEHKVNLIAQPSVDCTSYKEDSIELKFTLTTNPEVTLGEYKGIKIPTAKVAVSKDEVKEDINKLLEDNAELVLKEGEAAMGDTVVFDFKGYINGKEFEGGSAENYSLVLGSNQFVPGFEDQLVGVKAETKKDVNIVFPEQYIKDLAGKEAKFVCMVHEIKTKKVPELNDEFVKSLGISGVETVKALEDHESEKLLAQKTTQAKNERFTMLLNKIVEDAKLELPEALIANEANNQKQQLLSQIQQNGLTIEQYKEITGQTDESIDAQFRDAAISRLKEFLVLNKIAQVEKLTVSRADIDNYYSNVASTYNMNVEDVKKAFAANEQNIINNLYQNKIEQFLIDNNLEEVKKEEAPKAEEKKEPAKKAAPKKAASTEKKSEGAKKATKKAE